MLWLVLFAAILGFLYLRRFRIAVLVLAGTGVLLLGGFVIYLQWFDKPKTTAAEDLSPTIRPTLAEQPAATTDGFFPDLPQQPVTPPQEPIVTKDQLELIDVVWSNPDSKITGRVKNNSRHTVTCITAKIQLLDCDEDDQCDVIGEQEQSITAIIPAGQARDFAEWVRFPEATIRKRFDWEYTITKIQAKD